FAIAASSTTSTPPCRRSAPSRSWTISSPTDCAADGRHPLSGRGRRCAAGGHALPYPGAELADHAVLILGGAQSEEDYQIGGVTTGIDMLCVVVLYLRLVPRAWNVSDWRSLSLHTSGPRREA